MFTQLSHASLRRLMRGSSNVQTDMVVFLYFVTRWNYRSPKDLVFCSCADIVKGTGVHPSSAKASAERLLAGGFLIAKQKKGCASAAVYAMNGALIYRKNDA